MRPTGIPAKATRASRLAEDVRQAILDGKMPPGAKIILIGCATPTGFAEPFERGRGAADPHRSCRTGGSARLSYCRRVTRQLAEVTRLRAKLESLAVGIATNNAERLGSGSHGRAASPGAHRSAGDPRRWDAAHANLHTTLAARARDAYCRILPGPYGPGRRYEGCAAPARRRRPCRTHRDCRGGSGARIAGTASCRPLRDHIEQGGERLLHQFRTMTGAMP